MTADPLRLTVVIPTRNRPEALGGAIRSALGQTVDDLEVIVVDDASTPAARVPSDPRVRSLRLERQSGVSAARNAGLKAARGRWVTFLDDDNRLLPDMVERSLAAIAAADLPPPVAAVSGIEVIGPGERILDTRIPPTHPRGEHHSLEHLMRGRSHMTKQTLVAETELLRSLGGFDEDLPSRELSDLFLRLNPVCSIVGVPAVTYQLTRTGGPRLSRDPAALERGFEGLVAKHRGLLEAHPRGHADALLGHARMSLVVGPRRAVLPSLARAVRVAPGHTLTTIASPRRAVGLLRTWSSSG